MINDAAVGETAGKVLKAAFGDKFRAAPPVTASEDYSEYINSGVPSMFFNIGADDPDAVAAAQKANTPLPEQPFPAVRAGAEANHPDRRHGDDACRAQRIRTAEGPVAVRVEASLAAR